MLNLEMQEGLVREENHKADLRDFIALVKETRVCSLSVASVNKSGNDCFSHDKAITICNWAATATRQEGNEEILDSSNHQTLVCRREVLKMREMEGVRLAGESEACYRKIGSTHRLPGIQEEFGSC
jgi:hypothetical protein